VWGFRGSEMFGRGGSRLDLVFLLGQGGWLGFGEELLMGRGEGGWGVREEWGTGGWADWRSLGVIARTNKRVFK